MAGSSDEVSRNTAPDPLEIENAARAWGVETEYWDIWGQQHHASTELEMAILRSLGVDTSSIVALGQAIERYNQRQWRSPFAPAIFLTVGRTPHEISVSLPVERADSPAVLHLGLEDGGTLDLEVEPGATRLRLPDDLPLGYHQLSLEIAGESWPPSRLMVCPERAYEPAWLASGSNAGRAAGLAISLYGLRSRRNWGCGDTSDLCALIDWAAESTQTSFIALNP